MTWDRIVVDLFGVGLIGFVVWVFWLVKTKGVKAAIASSGYQEGKAHCRRIGGSHGC